MAQYREKLGMSTRANWLLLDLLSRAESYHTAGSVASREVTTSAGRE